MESHRFTGLDRLFAAGSVVLAVGTAMATAGVARAQAAAGGDTLAGSSNETIYGAQSQRAVLAQPQV